MIAADRRFARQSDELIFANMTEEQTAERKRAQKEARHRREKKARVARKQFHIPQNEKFYEGITTPPTKCEQPWFGFTPEFGCVCHRSFLWTGRMWIFERRVCFYSNLFGKEVEVRDVAYILPPNNPHFVQLNIKGEEIEHVRPYTIIAIQSALEIQTSTKRHRFTHFQTRPMRDHAIELIARVIKDTRSLRERLYVSSFSFFVPSSFLISDFERKMKKKTKMDMTRSRICQILKKENLLQRQVQDLLRKKV